MADTDKLTVSDLTELIKITLKEAIPNRVCVGGEISNFKVSKNNLFFTLKDDMSSISVTAWSMANKYNNLTDGKFVNVTGNITIYNKSGTYNINAYKIELVGTGNLYLDYINTKTKYEKLGYFDDARKKKLPQIINKIGVITATGGAALQDFLYIIKQNNFNGTVYVKNCIVQGKDCPYSVATAIKQLDDLDLDVLIVTRGGGSYEDLCGFSDVLIIEALYNCNTPTISAIGHEIDFMLSDFVADIRAPTPSLAGQLISSKKEDILSIKDVINIKNKIVSQINTKLKWFEYELNSIKPSSPLDIIERKLQTINLIKSRINNQIFGKINNMHLVLSTIKPLLPKQKDEHIELLAFDGSTITSYTNFMSKMGTKKKMKIKFSDKVVSFEVRNIKNEP